MDKDQQLAVCWVHRVVLNLFINGLGDGTVCTLSKFAGVTWLGGVGDTAEGGAAVQRDLDSWTNGLMGTS